MHTYILDHWMPFLAVLGETIFDYRRIESFGPGGPGRDLVVTWQHPGRP